MKKILRYTFFLLTYIGAIAQNTEFQIQDFLSVSEVSDAQPILAQAIRISEALTFIGSPLPLRTREALTELKNKPYSAETTERVQSLLDPFCLFGVDINPEARVKVLEGPADSELIQGGWKTFLIKVKNDGAVTAPLKVESPNAEPELFRSSFSPRVLEENKLTQGDLANRFLELMLYKNRPLKTNLSGIGLQYAIIQIYSTEKGLKEAKIRFNVGQGTQDIGFRNTVDILFDCKPSVKVNLKIEDFDGSPTMGSFIFMDEIDRYRNENEEDPYKVDYRLTMARYESFEEPPHNAPYPDPGNILWGTPRFKYDSLIPTSDRLIGIYPLPSRRLASIDEYPDFYFQPQIYRSNGEHVYLPPGKYAVYYGRGPEYYQKKTSFTVLGGIDSVQQEFKLERWINMAQLGWYSGDHHIHAAGCTHYESPEEGVLPEHMWRQIRGEDLNFGSNLSWGPCWYYQKEFFTGKDYPLSDENNILHYDVEVSGFPSSHAGHLVLLNLKEDDYPNTTEIEDWPSWTLPVLKWAKDQGGVVGYAHSGNGLEPIEKTDELPNYIAPKMDGIGANEYIMTVAHDLVDFYSLGDTPALWELNMWYHTLNAGFETKVSGETDFPCISDERVGESRIYAELEDGLGYVDFIAAIKNGKSYVSDGFSHLIDFKVDDQKLGDKKSELRKEAGSNLGITVKAAAYLTEQQSAKGKLISNLSIEDKSSWHIERSRIGSSRKVPVELIVNGFPVEKKDILADGGWNTLNFNYTIQESSWIAFRVLPSSHTNPIFVKVDDKPVNVKKSIEWCLSALEKCWEVKNKAIREEEKSAAKKAYDDARQIYKSLLEK